MGYSVLGQQYENMEFKHPREQEIIDIMQFLEYSVKPDASYNGTVCFRFVEPPNGDDDTNEIVYAVSTDSGKKIATTERHEDSEIPSSVVSLSIDDFLHMYSGNASFREIASMCYSGRVKVDGIGLRALHRFASSFDFSSDKWKDFYAYQEAANTSQQSPSTSSTMASFPSAQTVAQIDNWKIGQKMLKRLLNSYHRNQPSFLFETASDTILGRAMRSLRASDVKGQHHELFETLFKIAPSSAAELLNIATPQASRRFSCTALDINIRTQRRNSNDMAREGPVDVLMKVLGRDRLARRNSTGSTRQGYIPMLELMLREVKIQTRAVFRKIKQPQRPPPKLPWVWSEMNLNKPFPQFEREKFQTRTAIRANIKRDFEIGKSIVRRKLGGLSQHLELISDPDQVGMMFEL